MLRPSQCTKTAKPLGSTEVTESKIGKKNMWSSLYFFRNISQAQPCSNACHYWESGSKLFRNSYFPLFEMNSLVLKNAFLFLRTILFSSLLQGVRQKERKTRCPSHRAVALTSNISQVGNLEKMSEETKGLSSCPISNDLNGEKNISASMFCSSLSPQLRYSSCQSAQFCQVTCHILHHRTPGLTPRLVSWVPGHLAWSEIAYGAVSDLKSP